MGEMNLAGGTDGSARERGCWRAGPGRQPDGRERVRGEQFQRAERAGVGAAGAGWRELGLRCGPCGVRESEGDAGPAGKRRGRGLGWTWEGRKGAGLGLVLG